MAGVSVASDKGLTALLVAVLVMCGGRLAAASNLVPAVYVFGDSTVDVGMNVTLPLPYGIDLPQDFLPTGRVSNGYNLADYISRQLGFENSPPPYLSLTPHTRRQILRGLGGVSYASGGSGILNSTLIMETSISLAEQVKFFADTKLQMTQYARGMGSLAALDELLAESLFLISAGGNDFFLHIANNPDSSDSIFQENLLSNFTKHVQTLYNLGARRFGIVGVPPVGCVPAVRVKVPFGSCFPRANKIVREFNSMVGEMMANFSTDPEQPGMTYSVGSSYNVLMNFTNDPRANGFTFVRRACCGNGLLGAEKPCKHNSTVCRNRASHLYWDFAHSTQATAEKGAAIIFNAPVEENFTAPINFRQLVSPRQHGSGGFSSA